jgi:hypothetical protein
VTLLTTPSNDDVERKSLEKRRMTENSTKFLARNFRTTSKGREHRRTAFGTRGKKKGQVLDLFVSSFVPVYDT